MDKVFAQGTFKKKKILGYLMQYNYLLPMDFQVSLQGKKKTDAGFGLMHLHLHCVCTAMNSLEQNAYIHFQQNSVGPISIQNSREGLHLP